MELQINSHQAIDAAPHCAQLASRERLHRITEVLIAIVFFTAAAFKAFALFEHSQPTFLSPLFQTRISRGLLAQIELAIATWLAIGGWSHARLISALIFLAALSAVATYDAAHSYPSCGCFGSLKISPLITLTFDVLAILALVATRPRSHRLAFTPPSRRRRAIAGGFFLVSSMFIWVACAYSPHTQSQAGSLPSNASDDVIVLTPQLWINQSWPLFADVDQSTALRRGRWLILMYHYDCDSCIRAIANYRAIGRFSISNRPNIAFIAIPPDAPVDEDPVPASSNYLRLKLTSEHEWFATTPLALYLENGLVRHVAEGDAAERPDPTWWQP